MEKKIKEMIFMRHDNVKWGYARQVLKKWSEIVKKKFWKNQMKLVKEMMKWENDEMKLRRIWMNEMMNSKIVVRFFFFNDVADEMRFEQSRLKNEIELIYVWKICVLMLFQTIWVSSDEKTTFFKRLRSSHRASHWVALCW